MKGAAGFVDRHRFVSDPDKDPDPTLSFTSVGKSEQKKMTFIHTNPNLHFQLCVSSAS